MEQVQGCGVKAVPSPRKEFLVAPGGTSASSGAPGLRPSRAPEAPAENRAGGQSKAVGPCEGAQGSSQMNLHPNLPRFAGCLGPGGTG